MCDIRTLADASAQDRDARLADVIEVVNAYLGGWPYARPIDRALTAYWQTQPTFQPSHIWIAYRDGVARAVLHGEADVDRETLRIHLLAVRPGGMAEAIALLDHAAQVAKMLGLRQMVGPHWASVRFYGGYVLGNEPYHPHWAVEATEAYVRAGFRITLFGVLMVRDLSQPIQHEALPAGYEAVAAPPREEYGARPFGYLAYQGTARAAHCYARWYPDLIGVAGGSVGQIGNVTTEEPHRGKGIARVLVQRCLQQLRDWGAAEALIATQLTNWPALRAYENAGFERRHNINEWSKTI